MDQTEAPTGIAKTVGGGIAGALAAGEPGGAAGLAGGRTWLKRQESPLRHWPRAKNRHGARLSVGGVAAGGDGAAVGGTCEKRQFVPLRH